MQNGVARQIELCADYVSKSRRIVFLGGAGVSTASGIPDFRSAGGLYGAKGALPPEQILSHSFFTAHPEEFFVYYRENLLHLDAQPNLVHRKLAAWERAGRLLAVITQNIDGLHQKAGSRAVYELHGSVYRNRCLRCGRHYGPEAVLSAPGVPHCAACGGVLKPEVTLYEEMLDAATLRGAEQAWAQADLYLIGGTSLSVYPAAGFALHCGDKPCILINRTPTEFDDLVTLAIHADLGEVFSKLGGEEEGE